jgi:hypothetical protein
MMFCSWERMKKEAPITAASSWATVRVRRGPMVVMRPSAMTSPSPVAAIETAARTR